MINRKMEPAKLRILPTPKEKFRMVGQVTALDTFQNNTRDFHESGLFSTTLFGRVGSPERLTRMAYIDIYIPIFHPRIFGHLCSLKQRHNPPRHLSSLKGVMPLILLGGI